MWNMSSVFQAAALASLLSLLGTGCDIAHGRGGRGGLAPTLYGEESARNVANPNAPFSIRAVSPSLAHRPHPPGNGFRADATQPCSPAQLSLWESAARSNGNRHSLRFAVGNAGEACRLRGFPSISLLRADGSIVGEVTLRKISGSALSATLSAPLFNPLSVASSAQNPPSDRMALPSPLVVLPPKGEASFELGWTAGSNCEPVSRIAIGMPGTGRAVVLPRRLVVCQGELLITAIAASSDDE